VQFSGQNKWEKERKESSVVMAKPLRPTVTINLTVLTTYKLYKTEENATALAGRKLITSCDMFLL